MREKQTMTPFELGLTVTRVAASIMVGKDNVVDAPFNFNGKPPKAKLACQSND